MKQSNTRFLSGLPKWLFWTIMILIVLFLLFNIYSMIIYKEAMASKHQGYSDAENRVLTKTDINKIKETTTFSGEKTYYVVFGLDKSNDKKLAFVPEKKGKIKIFDVNNIVTKEQISTQIVNECAKCQNIRVKPGMLNKKPIWEAAYEDNNNYVFAYYSMKDATRYEKFQMKRNYK